MCLILLTKNRVNTNDVREECGEENQDHGQGHHQSVRLPILQTARNESNPSVPPFNGEEKEEGIAHGSEQYPKSRDARAGVDKSDGECKENPANDLHQSLVTRVRMEHVWITYIITNTCR